MRFAISPTIPKVKLGMYYIYKDYELFPYLPRNTAPCPATLKTLYDIFIPAIKNYQVFWFNVLKALAPTYMTLEDVKAVFARITHSQTAWTNKSGSDILADYINGTNLTLPPFEQETLVDRGNVVKVIGNRKWSGGQWWLPFETLNINNLPAVSFVVDSVNRKILKPYLIHAMTTITTTKLEDGTYKANPFPDFNGDTVPLPIITKTGVNYIPEKMVKKIDENKPYPSPYNPPR